MPARFDGHCVSVGSFSISYCPGSLNIKSDALSCQFATNTDHSQGETILPATCREGLISWDVEKTIRQALQDEPDPGTGSPDCCFVPSSAHSTVINWINTAKFACHPGVGRTISLLKWYFWWEALERDALCYFF